MDYRFQISATPFDFFKMSMKKTYRSPLGMCNIVFFAAALILTVKFFRSASPLAQALMLMMCLLVPVVQPLGVYFKAKSYAAAIPMGLTLEAGKTGLTVEAGDRSENITWDKVSKVIDTGDCVILKLTAGTGYFLFNRILGNKRSGFIDYVNARIKQ